MPATVAASISRHWTHPQAIPRGLLRIYILTVISRAPITGYELMQRIEEKTEGAWRPGPGTIYPLLKSLVRERLVSSSQKASRTSRVSYTITTTGERALSTMRAEMSSFGRKERVVMRLVSDLVPNTMLVPMLLNRARDGAEFLRARIVELPEPDRTAALRELRTLTENQLDWIRSNLEPKRAIATRRKRIR
jgi:DNA-binding PadR family transcriptional regulator